MTNLREIENKLRTGLPLNTQKTLVLEDGIIKMPTALGLPLFLNMTAVAHLHLNGLLKMEAEPRLVEPTTVANTNKVKIVVDVKPK